jgi:hypothetical protein
MLIKELGFERLDWFHFCKYVNEVNELSGHVGKVGSSTALVRGILCFVTGGKWNSVKGLPFRSLGATETISVCPAQQSRVLSHYSYDGGNRSGF